MRGGDCLIGRCYTVLKMTKRIQTYKSNIPTYDRVRNYAEYWRLVEWSAIPTPMRKPQKQDDLAKELGIHTTTLSRWKLIPEFYRDVRSKIKASLRNELPDVFYALRNKIYKDGDAREIKLFLQWVDDFIEKTEVEHKGEITTTNPEVAQLAKEFESKLKDMLSKKQ